MMKATSATPIMSDAAVRAVRFGLRIAFSRASEPGHAPQAGRDRTDHVAHRAGEHRAEDRHAAEDDDGTEADERRTATAEPAEQGGHAEADEHDAGDRAPLGAAERSSATSRSAAIGGTFDARTAGIVAETRVTTIPTARDTTTVLGRTTMPSLGNSMPTEASIALSPAATPMPASSPSPEAMRPTTPASRMTARIT